MPSGPRKSGIPDSVLAPAPVSTTILWEVSRNSTMSWIASWIAALRGSDAIRSASLQKLTLQGSADDYLAISPGGQTAKRQALGKLIVVLVVIDHALICHFYRQQFLEHDKLSALGALPRCEVIYFFSVCQRGARCLRKFALLCHQLLLWVGRC